jgi:hypothetical protein
MNVGIRVRRGLFAAPMVFEFVGDNACSSCRLKDEIRTHETSLLSYLGGGTSF